MPMYTNFQQGTYYNNWGETNNQEAATDIEFLSKQLAPVLYVHSLGLQKENVVIPHAITEDIAHCLQLAGKQEILKLIQIAKLATRPLKQEDSR
jgi:hypothetical protein